MADPQCMFLTQDEVNSLVAQGWTQLSPIFPSESECVANCGSSSSSSSSSSSISSSSLSSSSISSSSLSSSSQSSSAPIKWYCMNPPSSSSSSPLSSSSSRSSVTGCNCQPSGMAATWKFTLSGIANGTCTDCANLNTTFTLTYTGGCLWQSNAITLCNLLGTNWGMSCVSNTWQISIPGNGAVARYTLPNASFSPFGPNTFTLASTGANCTGWPGTITITPV